MRNTGRTLSCLACAFGALIAAPRPALAGPPLICHPFDVGSAPLLPWGQGSGWNSPGRSYDRQRLVADTLRLLAPDAPVLARMENLRRATIYATADRGVAAELLAALLGRALAADVRGARDPLPWFDAGYLVESYRQARVIARWDMVAGTGWALPDGTPGLDGLPFVRKALELAGSSPAMAFAASLMTRGAAADQYRGLAAAGAPDGSLLAKNLRAVGER